MDSLLFRMQDTAQQYVEILAEILGIDVSIVDAQQMRIAGSGRMKERTGSMANYGNIMRTAMKTGQTIIVENPVEDPLCRDCPSREECDNLCEIWSPISLDGEAIGAIGCVCYTHEQKKMFLSRRSLFQQFFTQFSGLLENKAYDLMDVERNQNIRKLLENVLGRAQVGVLILNRDGKICDINRFGREILHISEQLDDYSGCEFTEVNRSNKEYQFSFGKQTRCIVADRYHVAIEPYDCLVLFSDAEFRSDISSGLLGLPPSSDLDRIVGQSHAIVRLKKDIQNVAASTSNVLITGESGTGKELVARAIHGESPRHEKPFLAVNCAALPENLLESELFGYVKGAFTGANPNGRAGLLEAAQGGTFFMDEVGDMPLPLQVKMLRVLEQREITRLGSNETIPIDIRFVFATNRNLEEMVKEGTFREDLYYRINVIPLSLPPLRERQEDIRLIASVFIRKFCSALKKECSAVSEDFWDALESYDWPGNIRELQNAIEYAINMMPTFGVLRSELLWKKLRKGAPEGGNLPIFPKDDWNLEHMEKHMISQCLMEYAGQKDGKRLAAQKLGISVATLYRKIKQYQLS